MFYLKLTGCCKKPPNYRALQQKFQNLLSKYLQHSGFFSFGTFYQFFDNDLIFNEGNIHLNQIRLLISTNIILNINLLCKCDFSHMTFLLNQDFVNKDQIIINQQTYAIVYIHKLLKHKLKRYLLNNICLFFSLIKQYQTIFPRSLYYNFLKYDSLQIYDQNKNKHILNFCIDLSTNKNTIKKGYIPVVILDVTLLNLLSLGIDDLNLLIKNYSYPNKNTQVYHYRQIIYDISTVPIGCVNQKISQQIASKNPLSWHESPRSIVSLVDTE